jgi:hypothetical protein
MEKINFLLKLLNKLNKIQKIFFKSKKITQVIIHIQI